MSSHRKAFEEEEMFSMNPMGKDSQESNNKLDSDKDSKTQSGLMRILSIYADKSSLNGVLFIKSSRYWLVKAIWTLLLIAALVAMGWHLYQLISKYYQFEKQSQIDLKFEQFPFPAVTICNENAVRRSRLDMGSKKLQKIVDDVSPEKLSEDVNKWEPRFENKKLRYNKEGQLIGNNSTGVRHKRETTPVNELNVRTRANSFLNELNSTSDGDGDEDLYNKKHYNNTWEAESKPSAFDLIGRNFRREFSNLETHVRQQMGHQIENLLIQCSFSGRTCEQRNFTLVMTSSFGNCYTLEYDKFQARDSGPESGLSLMLYLESREYIPGITTARGGKLVVHDPGTIPFPDDQGLSIAAGMENSIGLKRVSITRLGQPHNDCSDKTAFQKAYRIKYTRKACQAICRFEQIMKTCNCYDETDHTIASLVRGKTVPCRSNRTMRDCMKQVKWDFVSNNAMCSCHNPCREIDYDTSVSTKPWPNHAFANLLSKTICKEIRNDSEPICKPARMSPLELRENFAKVNIYFQTLNYQSMTEVPDYTDFQFISDIGGTLGLYVGLSILSICEVGHLIIAVCIYLCRRSKP